MCRLLVAAAMAAISLAFAGCAAGPTLDVIDWDHGARRGVVAGTYAPDLTQVQRPRCLAALSANQYATQQFVRVRYRHVRSTRSAIAPVPPGLTVKVGDVVELWPADCAAGAVSSISRILSTSGQP